MVREEHVRERGTILPLTLLYVVVAASLILVVVDASAYYLARRSLQAAADGAALAGAEQLAGTTITSAGASLPLDPDAACAAVRDYAGANDMAARYPGTELTCDAPAPGGGVVTITLRQQVRLPFTDVGAFVHHDLARGWPLTVQAHASLRCAGC